MPSSPQPQKSQRKAGSISVSRSSVFIGTTNEADYASVPGVAFFTGNRRSHGLRGAFHDRPGCWRNLRLVAQNIIDKIAPAIDYLRRIAGKRVQ